MLVWGSWWGGLCFYAIVVVPIGTEVIGSVQQGFITQRVSQWHNAISWVFLMAWFVESFSKRSKSMFVIGIALTFVNIALVVWHSRLTGMMDFRNQTVPGSFYSQHAVYLWITALSGPWEWHYRFGSSDHHRASIRKRIHRRPSLKRSAS